MPQWGYGAVLVAVGLVLIIGRRQLAPFTQGSLGATGRVRRRVERSWVMMGSMFALLGAIVLAIHV